MLRVSHGDRAAFARLVDVHGRSIEAYAIRLLGNPSAAQDIAQEVMLRLWLKAGEYDPARARLTTWLHQMAHNLCVDQIRAGRRLTTLADDASPELHATTEACLESVSGSATDLTGLLAELPERQRNALVLTYYQELSNKEVADIMGLGVRAVESLLVRARASLRQLLERQQTEGAS